MRKSAFVVFVIGAMLVTGAVSAGDWNKIGEKTVVFGNTDQSASVSTKEDSVSQFAFKISGEWVGLNEITLNFSDGSKQAIEDIPKVKPGFTSPAFSVNDGPKAISSIDFSYRAVSSASRGRATVTFLGQ